MKKDRHSIMDRPNQHDPAWLDELLGTPEEDAEGAPGRLNVALGAVGRAVGSGRLWFRAFRRTRPFWGALWSILGGAWIIKMMHFTFGVVVTGGWSYSAGYVLGGGMLLFGLAAMFSPRYKNLSGVLVFLLALAAFINANLGGFMVGTILGIIGGSMTWAWGEKKPRRRDRRSPSALEVPSGEPE